MILALLLLGGCLDATSRATDAVPEVARGAATDRTPMVRWQDCRGLTVQFDAEGGTVRSIVPDRFELRDETPATAPVLVEVLNCARATTDDAVLDDVAFARVYTPVSVREPGWMKGPPSTFNMDLVVAPPAFSIGLRHAGLASLPANFQATVSHAGIESWTFDGDGFQIHLSSQPGETRGQGATLDFLHWQSQGAAFMRHETRLRYEYGGAPVQVGPLRVVGDLPSGTLVGPADATLWIGQAYARADSTWTLDPTAFA